MSFKLGEIRPMTLKIAGQKFPAIFSFAAMAEIEEKLKKSYGDIIDLLIAGKLYSREYATIVCTIIRAAGGEIDDDEFMQWFTVDNLVSLNEQLGKLFVTQAGGDEAKPEKKVNSR